MNLAKSGLFAALISVAPFNHGAMAAELYGIGPVCTTPETVLPGKELWLRQDFNSLRRLGCRFILTDVLQLEVLRCGIRGPTPEHEVSMQFYYPVVVDPALPYRIREIEASTLYRGTERFFTSFVNIRWYS